MLIKPCTSDTSLIRPCNSGFYAFATSGSPHALELSSVRFHFTCVAPSLKRIIYDRLRAHLGPWLVACRKASLVNHYWSIPSTRILPRSALRPQGPSTNLLLSTKSASLRTNPIPVVTTDHELSKWMDESKGGIVHVCLGTHFIYDDDYDRNIQRSRAGCSHPCERAVEIEWKGRIRGHYR